MHFLILAHPAAAGLHVPGLPAHPPASPLRTFTVQQQVPQTAAGLQAGGPANLAMQTCGSQMTKYQEIHIQERSYPAIAAQHSPRLCHASWSMAFVCQALYRQVYQRLQPVVISA